MENQERRRHPRRVMCCPIRLLCDDLPEELSGQTRDVSACGTFFVGTPVGRIRPGATVTVHIGIPEKPQGGFLLQTLTGKARVVRLERADDGQGTGIALHFAKELEAFAP